MTQSFRDMLALFASGATGAELSLNHQPDMEKIFSLASVQGVWQTVFLAAQRLAQQGRLTMEPSFFAKCNRSFIQSATRYTQRQAAVHYTMKRMEDEGIPCTVLKGETVARLYQSPVCRVSSDTDLLIDPTQEAQAAALLATLGYQVEKRPKQSHHFACLHPVAGLLEMHVALYGSVTEDVLFEGKMRYDEPLITLQAEDGTSLRTLGVNDGLWYLTVHFIKHFFNQGVGVRQLMDLLLYMREYREEINWDSYHKTMEELKYHRFLTCLKAIGTVYFGLELPGDCACDSSVMEELLTDFEIGGVFGKEEAERADFYQLYAQERYARLGRKDYEGYMNRSHMPSLMERLFPPKKTMQHRFPYTQKHPWLLPAAHVHRMARLAVGVARGKNSVRYQVKVVDNDVLKERMELVRRLGML